MKVGITGSSGFVGGALARAFAASGWTVVPFGRREPAHYELSAPVDPTPFRGLDAIVHAAYSPSVDNVAAMQRLLDAVSEGRVPRFAFVSSLAASEGAASSYGRDKRRAERLLDPASALVLRPGLVAGPGGLYGAMRSAIRRFGIAPVFGSGSQPVYLVDLEEFAAATVRLMTAGATGTYLCAGREPIAFGDLCREIGRAAGRGVRLIRLPLAATLATASFLEAAGLSLPVSPESVRGIANLRDIDIPGYEDFGIAFSPARDVIARAESAAA